MYRSHNQVVVYGAGGHVKVVLATLEAEGKYRVIGLLDDNESKHSTTVYGYQVLGGREQLARLRNEGISNAVVAIGDNLKRADLAQLLREHGFQLVRVIHPTAILLRGSRIGEGTVILPNAYVGADAIIGDNTIVSVGVVVGHDCVVGSWVQLCPKASLGGQTRVGDYSFIGMGVSVLLQVTVGRKVVVGANAVVTADLPDRVTAAGVPARILNQKGQHGI